MLDEFQQLKRQLEKSESKMNEQINNLYVKFEKLTDMLFKMAKDIEKSRKCSDTSVTQARSSLVEFFPGSTLKMSIRRKEALSKKMNVNEADKEGKIISFYNSSFTSNLLF